MNDEIVINHMTDVKEFIISSVIFYGVGQHEKKSLTYMKIELGLSHHIILFD